MTDVRRIVAAVADALGREASPERVESIASAIIESIDLQPATSPVSRSDVDRIIVTVYGLDRPGILAGITNVVSGAQANILDVSQRILQGYFTLIMTADVPHGATTISELQKQLSVVGDELKVRVMVQRADLFDAMHRP